jgi:hypothetical protein
LTSFRQAIEDLCIGRLQILAIAPAMVPTSAALSQQIGLLSNDAAVVAIMQCSGLTRIASNDPDFDRVPGLTRYAPAQYMLHEDHTLLCPVGPFYDQSVMSPLRGPRAGALHRPVSALLGGEGSPAGLSPTPVSC